MTNIELNKKNSCYYMSSNKAIALKNNKNNNSRLNIDCQPSKFKKTIIVNKSSVGTVINKTYQKTISGSKHFLKIPPAISINISELKEIEECGVIFIEITDRETGLVYKTRVEYIKNKGCEFNRGWGDQIFLPLPEWIIINSKTINISQLPLGI